MYRYPRALWIVVMLSIVAAGCRSKTSVSERNQRDYEVVSEGSASGVTSTIAAPGETLPTLVTTGTAPLTGTNIDTTTAFNLPIATETTVTGPGNLASTLPAPAPRPQRRPEPAPAPSSPPPGETLEPPPQAEPDPSPETPPEPPPTREEEEDEEGDEEPPPTSTQPPG